MLSLYTSLKQKTMFKKKDYIEDKKERYFVFVPGYDNRQPRKAYKSLELAEVDAIALAARINIPVYVSKIYSRFHLKKVKKVLEVTEQ
jgi:hypothetical protein